MNLTFYLELALSALLAVTLVYCIVLERRLAAIRKGQDGLKATVAQLNGAVAAAGASLRALKAAAGDAAGTLDGRISRARAHIDELSVLVTSAERIADRIERVAHHAPGPRPTASNGPLPSESVMSRLDTLKAVR